VRIDLHIHSTASDGTLTPAEILEQALALKLGAIAITDHDSIDGSRQAMSLGIPPSLGFLTGVEISASPPSTYQNPGSFHILGYRISLSNVPLNQSLTKLQNARENRNPRILAELDKLGISISMQELLEVAGDGQAGRPHIARVLIDRKIVATIEEAFDRYLGTGKVAYVDKFRIDCATALQLINDANGVAVLAHPGLLDLDSDQHLAEILQELKGMGLGGIEVYYPEHSPRQTIQYIELAKRFDLLMSGGSDFHGSIHPVIKMGTGRGDLKVPFDVYEKLIQFSN
jgi:hypothetical protein